MIKICNCDSVKKMKDLFIGYNRNYFSNDGYFFIKEYIKKFVKKFDVIQICGMFSEENFFDFFGEKFTTHKRFNELVKERSKTEYGLNVKLLPNKKVIYWYNPSFFELLELDKMD